MADPPAAKPARRRELAEREAFEGLRRQLRPGQASPEK
jgi:hypothetical protein